VLACLSAALKTPDDSIRRRQSRCKANYLGGGQVGLGLHSFRPSNQRPDISADCLAVRAPSRVRSSCAALIATIGLVTLAGVGAVAQTATAETHITSNVTSNSTWTAAGSPYLLDREGGVQVASGVTLTVQPGVTVEFNSTKTLSVLGTLTAIGTPTSRIVFTSRQGAEHEGAPGQYNGITILANNASSQFSYADFLYGGRGCCGPNYYLYGELTLNSSGSGATIDHSTFEYNEWSGLLNRSTGIATVSYSTFAHNGDGIAISNQSPGQLLLHGSRVIENVQDGIFYSFGEKSTAVGADITNNDISGNGRYGLNVWAYCAAPVAAFPHGTENDIYGNGPSPQSPSDGSEIHFLYLCEAIGASWAGNYWGNAELLKGPTPLLLKGFVCKGAWPKEWFKAASVQQSAGYLAYSGRENGLAAPPGPISTSSYPTYSPPPCLNEPALVTTKNVYNSLYIDQIQQDYIPIPTG